MNLQILFTIQEAAFRYDCMEGRLNAKGQFSFPKIVFQKSNVFDTVNIKTNRNH